jgi:phage terminase small subunit
MLTHKQQQFCLEYIIDGNGTKAATRAGYSKASAAKTASRMLKKGHIAAHIQSLRSAMLARTSATAEAVIQELAACGLSNVQDYINKDGTPVPIERLTRTQAAAIQELTSTVNAAGTMTTKLKLVDKRASLVDLGRHFGVFELDNAQAAGEQLEPAANLKTARLLAFALRKAAELDTPAEPAASAPPSDSEPRQH